MSYNTNDDAVQAGLMASYALAARELNNAEIAFNRLDHTTKAKVSGAICQSLISESERKFEAKLTASSSNIALCEKSAQEKEEANKKKIEELEAKIVSLTQTLEDTKGLVTTAQEETKIAKERSSALTVKVQGLEQALTGKGLILSQQHEQSRAPQPEDEVHAPMADCSEYQSELQECNERLNDCQDSYGNHGHSVMTAGRLVSHQNP